MHVRNSAVSSVVDGRRRGGLVGGKWVEGREWCRSVGKR